MHLHITESSVRSLCIAYMSAFAKLGGASPSAAGIHGVPANLSQKQLQHAGEGVVRNFRESNRCTRFTAFTGKAVLQ